MAWACLGHSAVQKVGRLLSETITFWSLGTVKIMLSIYTIASEETGSGLEL